MNRLRPALAQTVGGLPRAFWWLWLGTLVNRMGSFVIPFLAFYLTGQLHFSVAFTGVVLSIYGGGVRPWPRWPAASSPTASAGAPPCSARTWRPAAPCSAWASPATRRPSSS